MAGDASREPWVRRVLWTPVGLLVVALLAMWAVEALDTMVLDDQLQDHGIRPRQIDGLVGVGSAPFLHSDWGHVASNTVPLLALGALVAVRGMRYWGRITAAALVGGGVATWALAGAGNHVGASGVVFGYFGAILGAAVVERRPRALAPALLAVGFYSSLIAGLVPQEFISWEGHLFGMLAGFVAAWLMAEPPPPPRVERPEDVQPWELDEPWLDGDPADWEE
ncbi:MAG: rhomboid family intramembrane serine protease [Acidimicrobiia bacterium]|nr:rhomboid family intramembrane serine protease [Acidimicrobiia bacterium]